MKTVKSAGDAGEAELVRVLANPRLFRGCLGQVIVLGVTVSGTEALEVSREQYEALREVEISGVQAVVLA